MRKIKKVLQQLINSRKLSTNEESFHSKWSVINKIIPFLSSVNATPSTVLLSTTDIMPPNLPPFETIFESKLPLF